MDSSDSTCLVCHETIEIYAIGTCDHAICFKCSTRLRALCDQFYCPICRRDLPEVYFMAKRERFDRMPIKNFIKNRKLKICFENEEIREDFEKLLEHRCKICKNRYPEKSFRALRDHMSRTHTLFFCNLCLELKIFTSERKLYTRQDLATHRRIGDKDDTSYKGHPLCEFCDDRYLDKDELYKHLRKDHYFCHFCESLGSQDFFDTYEVLRDHFAKEHFLCEEGDCINAKFENAFRSHIDYQSHVVTHHSKAQSKHQARQERTLNIDINLVPRPSNRGRGVINGHDYEENRHRGPPARYQGGRGGKNHRNDREDRDMERAMQASLSTMKEVKPKRKSPDPVEEEVEQKPDLQDEQNFPTLNGASASATNIPNTRPNNQNSVSKASLANKVALANNMSVQHGLLSTTDFPGLKKEKSSSNLQKTANSNMQKMKPAAPMNKVAANKVTKKEEDFPELPISKKPVPEPSGKWMKQETSNKHNSETKPNSVPKQKKKTDKSSSSKVVINDSDFPSLSGTQSDSSGLNKWFKPVTNSNSFKKDKNESWNDSTSDMFVHVYERFSPVNVPNDNLTDKSKNNKKKKKEKTETIKEKENIKSNSSLDNIASMLLSNSNSNSCENIEIAKHDDIKSSQVPDKKSASKKKEGKQNIEKRPKKEDKIEKKLDTEGYTKAAEDDAPTAEVSIEPGPVRFAIDGDDFPSLGSASKSAKRAPPGFKSEQKDTSIKAPPGLMKPPGAAPPPGFGISSEPAIKKDIPLQDSILISGQESNFKYAQPDGFSERNKMLIGCIQVYCDDVNKFNDFKVLSGEFRKGEISASSYYQRCQEVLGKKNFAEIFPELLALLPDIEKQQQLLSVDMEKEGMKKDSGVLRIGGKSKIAKGAWTLSESGFLTCQTCKQVLTRKDYNQHVSSHSLDSDFPSLGVDLVSNGFRQGSWVKAK